jgi:hypothetical protein
LRVSPPTALQPELDSPERMLAHSDRLVLPMMMAPAARSRATSGASRPVSLLASAREPAVVGSSRVSMLSLIEDGHAEERGDAAEKLWGCGVRIDGDDRVDVRINAIDPIEVAADGLADLPSTIAATGPG